MKNELVKLNMDQYGLQEQKAKDIEKLYLPMIGMLTDMEKAFNEIVTQDITAELVPKAKRLRLDIAKVRISANKARESAKAEYLRAGNAIQGAFNTLKYAVESKEEKLLAIEKHFETLERERIEKLQTERETKLAEYEPDMHVPSLGEMDESVWKNFIQGIKVAYDQRKEAERKAEADRIEVERLDKLGFARRNKAYELKQFWHESEFDFRGMNDNEFENLMISLNAFKTDYEQKQIEIEKENDRLKIEAEAAERKRINEEKERLIKAERDRKIREEKERKERADYELKLKTEREEKQGIADELQAKKDAELKAKKEAEAAEKRASQAPDKDKLVKSISEMTFIDGKFKTAEAQAVYNVVNQKFEAFKKWAIQQTESL